MNLKFIKLLILINVLSFSAINAQEYGSLLKQLDTSRIERPVSAFKSSRLILGQSTVQLSKDELQFRVSHLFGRISDGIDELFGLDQMYNVDLSFEYGITNSIQVGLARSNDFDKTVQTSFKYAVFKQSKTTDNPLSLTYFGSFNIKTKNYGKHRAFEDRLEYVNQLLVSRRLSEKFSAQVAPTYVFINRVPTTDHPHSLLATNLGVSMALTKSANLNIEYIYTFPTFDNDLYEMSQNALSLGMDIETGGHVFQVFITNSTRVQPGSFIQQYNNDDFFSGDIHLGFSIMRSFSL